MFGLFNRQMIENLHELVIILLTLNLSKNYPQETNLSLRDYTNPKQ